ncbi:MAG: UDP-N-acetylmuramate dehydrogenase [Bacteroidota bacterium]
MNIQEQKVLSEYTTLRLGGAARYFCSCTSVGELCEALEYAQTHRYRTHILGGGSNTIFADSGFDGLVVKMDIKGISVVDDDTHVLVTVNAGEDWDAFVQTMVMAGYAGVECLAGIPGLVGATPIQNVGAYGQEVKDTLVRVRVLDRTTRKENEFTNAECSFEYRQSRFKKQDSDKYIVTAVTFRLLKNGRPTINYPEVKKAIEAAVPLSTLADGKESLEAVRNVVLSLRRKKSMVIDPSDPNSRSAGSFFMNPIVSGEQFKKINDRWNLEGDGSSIPAYDVDGNVKISAAWLIEKSGYSKGYTKNGAGISGNHTLALVNRGGTAEALLALAKEIQESVERIFSVRLELEPVVVK